MDNWIYWLTLLVTSGVLSTVLTLITSLIHDKNELKKSKLIERIGVVRLTDTELDYKNLCWYLDILKTHNNNYDKKTYKIIEKRALNLKRLFELSGISFEFILYNSHKEDLEDFTRVSYIHFCDYSELICKSILERIKND